MKRIRKGDVGVAFDIKVTASGGRTPLNTVTTKELVFRAPSGSSITRPAAFITDGKDGGLRYVSVAGDFNETGKWLVQAHVIYPTGEDLRSSTEEFQVDEVY